MSRTAYQQGSVLIIALIVLLVLTLIGISGIQTNVMEVRMAGNLHERVTAFQAAEAGLRDGEADVASNYSLSTVFSTSCSSGRCEPVTSGTDVWLDSSKVNWDAGTNTINYSAFTSATTLPYSQQPRYIVERLQVVDRTGSLKRGFGQTNTSQWYRITAVGYSENGRAEAMVQSVYRK